MSSTMVFGGFRWCTLSIHWPDRSARAARFSGRVSHSVSKRPIWLAEAADPVIARSPTTQRIAGSRHKPFGVVHILVAGQPAKYRLPQQPDQQMPAVFARARFRQSLAAACSQAKNVVQLAVGE